MRRFLLVVFGLALLAGGIIIGARVPMPSWIPLGAPATPQNGPATADAERKPLFYRHPMTPTIHSPVPAKDDMGMDYIPVYEDGGGAGDDANLVEISPALVNNLGVRTEPVTRSTLARRIETVGYIDYDERLISQVNLRIEGWVEDLRVKTLGQRVSKGEILFRVYSRELVNAQEEYRQAMKAGNRALIGASRERLRALGAPDELIESLRQGRSARDLAAVYARQDGVVTELDIREGKYVRPSDMIMILADLSSVWVLVDVFEDQAEWVAAGQRAEVRLPYVPGEVWTGEVEYVYPALDPKTRTLRVRLRFPNPGEKLKPNMYANVTIHASPRDDVLSIPQEALIRSGGSQRVIVARGEGRFEALEVEPGIESGDRIEIRSGLEEGDIVVVSAQFMLDSEASLQASIRRMTEPEGTAAAEPVQAEGVVNSIQSDPPKVNLSHSPIPELGWDAMTMDFRVDGTVPLDGVKPGAMVRFELRQQDDGTNIITAITPTGP